MRNFKCSCSETTLYGHSQVCAPRLPSAAACFRFEVSGDYAVPEGLACNTTLTLHGEGFPEGGGVLYSWLRLGLDAPSTVVLTASPPAHVDRPHSAGGREFDFLTCDFSGRCYSPYR